MAHTERGRTLSIFAVLFGLLAISNLLKPLQLEGDRTGFVLFGERLSGTANLIAGPLFGAYQAVQAAGIWGMRRFALPMSRLYAAYVVLNVLLFAVREPTPPGIGDKIFGLVYLLAAVGASASAAWLLARRKKDLN